MTQIQSIKKIMTKRLTVQNLKLLLDGIPPKAKITFYNEKMIIINDKKHPHYYTIFNNGRVVTS